MSKTEELVKVCELLTHWGCEEPMARQAAIQIVSGHPCEVYAVFLNDNLGEQSEAVTSFVGDYGPELLCTETLVDPMRYQRTLDAICKNTSALCKHFGAEQTKSPSDEGREDEMESLIISTTEREDGKVAMDVVLPIPSYKIGSIVINGRNVWPNDLCVTGITLAIKGGDGCPRLTLDCFPGHKPSA